MSASIVVVEDDALIASSLERALRSRGFDVRLANGVVARITAIDGHPPDLVLLDLGLPDADGTEVAEHVAAHHPSVPVMVLTARGDELDIVVGLQAGAVDYVVKPFRLAELMARIDAQLRLRRAVVSSTDGNTGPSSERVIRVGDVTIDRAARRVELAGRELALRPKEFDLLTRLACDAGKVVTREQLIDDVWDENWWGSTKTLDVHINAVRRKLGEGAGQPSRITSIRGIGYRMETRSGPT